MADPLPMFNDRSLTKRSLLPSFVRSAKYVYLSAFSGALRSSLFRGLALTLTPM
jgi:hypothetical protein